MQIKLKKAKCLIDGNISSRDIYINEGKASFVPMDEEVLCEFDNCIFTPGKKFASPLNIFPESVLERWV